MKLRDIPEKQLSLIFHVHTTNKDSDTQEYHCAGFLQTNHDFTTLDNIVEMKHDCSFLFDNSQILTLPRFSTVLQIKPNNHFDGNDFVALLKRTRVNMEGS